MEYIGSPLSAYYEEPWIRRAKIAASLLEAAKMFTFRNPDFGFYLTDLSPDNIAVTENDEAKFIDLENIIIVDKNVSFSGKKQEASERITKLYEPDRTILSHLSGFLDRTATWDQMQANDESIECRNCLAFSPEDICHHRLSDHNYYAICQVNKILQSYFLIKITILRNFVDIFFLFAAHIVGQNKRYLSPWWIFA